MSVSQTANIAFVSSKRPAMRSPVRCDQLVLHHLQEDMPKATKKKKDKAADFSVRDSYQAYVLPSSVGDLAESQT